MVLSVFIQYWVWHYTRAVDDFTRVWKNILAFIPHFFSLTLLLRTIFSPWRRLGEGYKKGFNLTEFFETAVVNILMRCIGFLFRSVCIVFALMGMFFVLVFGGALFIAWLLMPIILPALLFFSISLFI